MRKSRKKGCPFGSTFQVGLTSLSTIRWFGRWLGSGGGEDLREGALDQAKENLDQWFGVVGLVEHFDESLLLMKKRYGWKDVSYYRRNVTPDRPEKEDYPQRVVREIKNRNRLDTELYEYGSERLVKKLEDVNIDQVPYSFRLKCYVRSRKKGIKINYDKLKNLLCN
jgi:hypothetical protein